MKESKDEKKKRLKQTCMVHGDICSSQKGDIRNEGVWRCLNKLLAGW